MINKISQTIIAIITFFAIFAQEQTTKTLSSVNQFILTNFKAYYIILLLIITSISLLSALSADYNYSNNFFVDFWWSKCHKMAMIIGALPFLTLTILLPKDLFSPYQKIDKNSQ